MLESVDEVDLLLDLSHDMSFSLLNDVGLNNAMLSYFFDCSKNFNKSIFLGLQSPVECSTEFSNRFVYELGLVKLLANDNFSKFPIQL